MNTDSGKELWSRIGSDEAYFGVVTLDEFQAGKLDANARSKFFESGEEHLSSIWPQLEKLNGGPLTPRRSLDYGCGVGRVLLPLANRSHSSVGIDISESMLEECRRNLVAEDIGSVTLIEAGEFMAMGAGAYDLVHSFIVMQHIEPKIGLSIIRKLVDGLEPKGFGVIHATYRDRSGSMVKMRNRIYRTFPGLHRAVSGMLGRSGHFMPMYEYDRAAITQILEAAGCEIGAEIETDHGFAGSMFIFRKG